MKGADTDNRVRMAFVLLLMTLAIALSGCGKQDGAKKEETSVGAGRLEEAIATWAEGRKYEAEARFLTIQWEEECWASDYSLCMTEREFVELSDAERAEVRPTIDRDIDLLRDLSRHILQKGRSAAAQGEVEEARHYFVAGRECGDFLKGNPKALAILRAVGEGLSKGASRELKGLAEREGP